jgi:integrase
MAIRARGEGTISRRRNGTYEGKLSLKAPDGTLVRKSFYGKTRGAVADMMREYRDEHGTVIQPRNTMTLSAYLIAWLDALVVRPNTYKLRKHLINKHIVPHIGARSLVDLTSDDIRFLVRRWKDDDVGATTQRTALVTLSNALNVALREEKIGRNPCSTVPTPKPKRPEVAVLDGQQVMRLLGAARDVQERALFALAITTGMRQGEIFALSWADLDFVAGTVSVRATLTEDLDGQLVRSRTEDHEVAARHLSPGPGAHGAPSAPDGARDRAGLRLHRCRRDAATQEQLHPARLQAAPQVSRTTRRHVP